MPRPYALQVTSRPNQVSEDVWRQWYTEEHIRDLVYSGASKTSAVYRASSETVAANVTDNVDDQTATTFLALYQSTTSSVLEACRSTELKCKVRVQSSLFEPGQTCYDVGIFKPLDLQLVEILGSYEQREDVAPHVLHHVIAGDEIENKIQFDHVNAVANIKGYRRTLLYRPLQPTRYGAKDIGPFVLLLHEFDDEVEATVLGDVKGDWERIEPTMGCSFWLRVYDLIESEGFGGRCRTPERVEK